MGGKIMTPTQATTMTVNGTDIFTYNALIEKFSVSGTEIKNETYQGVNRTNYNLLNSLFYMKTITISIFLSADTRRNLTLAKSRLDSLMWGKVELGLPDGFYYTATLQSTGELAIVGIDDNSVIALCEYTFTGIQHDPLVTSTGNTIDCQSTIPYTDCRLTCTASQAYSSITIGTVTITGVASGDVLVVDGINGRILQNGAPCAGNMSFRRFPSLTPGSNTFNCPEELTIEYYPTYI